jgi:hypothetical protein
VAGEHILVPSMELAKTELFKSLGGQKINEPSHPSRQPGYLSETRGFPSPPCDEFGFIIGLIKIIELSSKSQQINEIFLRKTISGMTIFIWSF